MQTSTAIRFHSRNSVQDFVTMMPDCDGVSLQRETNNTTLESSPIPWISDDVCDYFNELP